MPKKARDTTEFSGTKKYQQVILTIAIAIVLVAFVMYGSSVIYEEPTYDRFCLPEKMINVPETKISCEQEGGLWQPHPETRCLPQEKCPKGWCDQHHTCRKTYEQERKVYERNVFFIVSTLGLIALTTGLSLQLATVSAGISIGGLILLIISIVRYWNEFGKYIRLLLLGLVLAALIFIAYKKFGKR